MLIDHFSRSVIGHDNSSVATQGQRVEPHLASIPAGSDRHGIDKDMLTVAIAGKDIVETERTVIEELVEIAEILGQRGLGFQEGAYQHQGGGKQSAGKEGVCVSHIVMFWMNVYDSLKNHE